jgi:dTDP-glucose 4,6-dehydratase
MNILITGVAGFIGSNFAHYIAERYPAYNITGVDNLSPYSSRANIARLEEAGKIEFRRADIADFAAMQDIYQTFNPDHVVNFAAESHNDRAIIDPSIFVRSNVLGAQTLLELSRTIGVKRHIHISTIEVYGEQSDETPWFDESSPLNAKTPYSASKAAADMIVRAYMQTYPAMDIAMTHCANNYGPYQFPEKLIPLAVTNLLRDKKVPLYGDGLQKRDWLHVSDHCRAIDLVLHREGKYPVPHDAATNPGLLPIFDISARQEMTNIEMIRIICDELARDFDDWVDFVSDRPNHDRRYLINPRKIENDLRFAPHIDPEPGIRATVRWYAENRGWWEDILARSGSLQIDWARVAGRSRPGGAS